MPAWFGRRPPAGPPPSGPGDRGEADRDALARGEVPASTRARLERERARSLPWTSTLSVSEWALARSVGAEPVGLVMGSSVYHTGWSYLPSWQSGELEAPTRAAHAVRALALERLRQEASLLGAHGVVAVRLERSDRDWGSDLMEFTAVGTAVRFPRAQAVPRPFLATVGADDLYRLLQAGWLCVDLCLGVSVAYLATDWTSMWQAGSWTNTEVDAFTSATYTVRELAMRRLAETARAARADGVIAYDINLSVERVERGGGGQERTDHVLEFVAMGTAVVRADDRQAALPAAVVPLADRPPPA